MEKKENFTEGLARMQELAGKSHEHICREFKKRLNITPTEFINSLRLNYAKNLLMNSDESIIDIAMEAGFGNLSHFYHLFRKQYNISPSDFRKKYQESIIPL